MVHHKKNGLNNSDFLSPTKVCAEVQTSQVKLPTDDNRSNRSRSNRSHSSRRSRRFEVDDMIRDRVGITAAQNKHERSKKRLKKNDNVLRPKQF